MIDRHLLVATHGRATLEPGHRALAAAPPPSSSRPRAAGCSAAGATPNWSGAALAQSAMAILL